MDLSLKNLKVLTFSKFLETLNYYLIKCMTKAVYYVVDMCISIRNDLLFAPNVFFIPAYLQLRKDIHYVNNQTTKYDLKNSNREGICVAPAIKSLCNHTKRFEIF